MPERACATFWSCGCLAGMKSVQWVIIATGVVMVAAAGSVPGALAQPKPKPSLKVAPAKPGVKTAITVVFRGRKLRPGRPYDGAVPYFGAVLHIDSNNSDGRCAYTVTVALRRSSGGAGGQKGSSACNTESSAWLKV